MNNNEKIKPFIKWAGGKEKELKYIKACLPNEINRYIEPFLGGGAVYFDINIDKSLINDKSHELINLYKCVKQNDTNFINHLRNINSSWKQIETFLNDNEKTLYDIYTDYANDFNNVDCKKALLHSKIEEFIANNKDLLIELLPNKIDIKADMFIKEVQKNLKSKITRMNKIEKEKGKLSHKDTIDNLECAIKSGFYMYMRYLYNNASNYDIDTALYSAIFYFIREYCYASMFRYNTDGKFNVPYGGISYNKKDFSKKIDYINSEKLKKYMLNTSIYSDDFETFMDKVAPKENDFIFLDPPYDTEFSTYAQNSFDKNDQIRLAEYLKNTKAKFMLVIKNTDFIYNLYNVEGLKIQSFDKKYLVSFQNRNDKNVEHLLITNY